MRKKNFKLRQYNLGGARVNSGQISRQSQSYFIIGDSHNNVRFYMLNSDEELMVTNLLQKCMNSNQNANVQTEVSAVSFNTGETQVFSGSNRGMINVWDISTGKTISSLKGHPTSVNCFGIFSQQPDRLASGSYDTHIKLWDIRTKNNTSTLKSHSKQINSIDVSPDCKMLISGSEDSTVKLWDLRFPQKILYTYSQHSAPILKILFNPQDRRFASSSVDRTAKYFQSEHNNYNYLSSTDLIATPITAMTFSTDGRQLYTAANDSLKVWNMAKNGLLLDQIDSSWKGVIDIGLIQGALAGIGFNSGAISTWIWSFGKKSKESNQQRVQIQKDKGQKARGNVRNFEDMKEALQNINNALDIVKNIDEKKQMQFGRQKLIKDKDRQKSNQKQERQKQKREQKQKQKKLKDERQLRIKIQRQIKIERQIREQQQRNKIIEQQRKLMEQQEEKRKLQKLQKQRLQRQKGLQSRIKNSMEDNLITEDMQLSLQGDLLDNSSLMNLSTFVGNGAQKQKLIQIQIIGDILKGSYRISSIINERMKTVKAFSHYWQSGKIKEALITLNQIQTQALILDCLTSILKTPKFKTSLTPEPAVYFLRKLIVMLGNKHSTFVKKSMNLINDIVLMFKDELIKVKNFNPLTRVDLSREQRLAKYDMMIEQFRNAFRHERLKKYANIKKPQNMELSEIAVQLYKNLEEVLRKVMPKIQPQAL